MQTPKTFVSDGTSYFVTGEGKDLVLIHGFLSLKESFLKLAALLSKHFRVWAYDLVGHGASKPGPGHLTKQVKQLHSFLQRQGLKNPILLGHSMGGGIAQAYAALHPQQIEALILISSADLESYPRFWNSPMVPWRFPGGSGKDWLFRFLRHPWGVQLLQNMAPEAFVRHTLRRLYASSSVIEDSVVQHYVQAMQAPGFWESFPQLFSEEKIAHLEKILLKLEKIKTPVLVGWGKEDPWFRYPQAEKIAAYYHHAQVKLFENVGHVPHEENPQLVFKSIEDWVQRVF